MKEVVIVSGKGGVGKTSLTASLAYLFSSNNTRLVVVDTDVDAPNLALLLKGEKVGEINVKASEKAFIDYAKCDSCGMCVKYCKENAILWNSKENKPYIFDVFCEGCGVCSVVCPRKAIKIELVENGSIVISHSTYGFLVVTGQLKIGEAGSGKIVMEVKLKANEIAKKNKADILLVDGPPGTGCPAIAAVSGAHYAILITEPTPAALSDLKRIYEIVKHFQAPSGLVINKADLEENFKKEIYKFAEREGIQILGEIPLDNAIPYSLAQGIPVIEYAPNSPASKSIKKIAEKILQTLLGE
ncbi:MAG: ATP-binding protein [Candidatus Odinarchaeota archaeon]|nr:ATP-binding protein [Candidatus Odinarchaeota archaeon]